MAERIHYRSVADLNRCITDNIHTLPDDIDVIAVVPRSGMVAASIMALYLDVALTDFYGLLKGRIMQGGRRTHDRAPVKIRRALIVDDAIASGWQIEKIRQELDNAELNFPVDILAVYVPPDKTTSADHCFEVLPYHQLFEWTRMNHVILPHCCVDMDGVLCRDATPEEDDDGERYRAFLADVEPKLRPKRKIGWIVTSRLEKYRDLTEAWLARHDIHYDQLIMLDLPDKQARLQGDTIVAYKSKNYISTAATLFIESSVNESIRIAQFSGRPVLCIDNSEMILPSDLAYIKGKVNRLHKSAPRKVLRLIRRFFDRGEAEQVASGRNRG